jgi:SMODS and SLOG-associating 2TM effector domain family 5
MPDLDPQPRLSPRVVSSIEDAMATRRPPPNGHSRTGSAGTPADQLLHAMHTVKAARFNAAERLERKHLISVFALSMVSLYFVGLSVWQTIYAASLDAATNQLVTLVSIMSSICTLVLALIDSMNDYKIKAHHMHACALDVNDLLQELRLLQTSDTGVVQDFRRRYNEVVRGCPYNHTRVDYLMARAERKVPWEAKVWAHLRYALDVYGLYGACLIGPPMVLLLFR